VTTRPPRLRRAGLVAGLVLLASCGDGIAPGSQQAVTLWQRDFAPRARVTLLGGGPGAIALATGDSLLVLDNATGSRLFAAPWRDTIVASAFSERFVAVGARTGVAVWNRANGALLFRDSSETQDTLRTAAVALRDTIVVVLRSNGALRALVAGSGRELWRVAPVCGAVACASHRLVTLRDVAVATGRFIDGTGSYVQSVRVASGVVVPLGVPARPSYVVNTAVASDSDLVVVDQTRDSVIVFDGLGPARRWSDALRVPPTSNGTGLPPLTGDTAPYSRASTVMVRNRTSSNQALSVYDRNGDGLWQRAPVIPIGGCGARYVIREADGYYLVLPRDGRRFLRVAPPPTADNPPGTPRDPVVAGDVVLVWRTPAAFRVHAC
jgi:hypothetical protein